MASVVNSHTTVTGLRQGRFAGANVVWPRQVKGAVEGAKDKAGLGGLGGALEGLKDKINGAAITDESPAKNLTDVSALP